MRKKPGRGGARPGSGRPSLYETRTKPIRVPEDLVAFVLDHIKEIRDWKDGKSKLTESWE